MFHAALKLPGENRTSPHRLGQAKVGDPRDPIRAEKNVGRFDVAVDKSPFAGSVWLRISRISRISLISYIHALAVKKYLGR